MKELVIISGKGGTGKTSVTAAFAALAGEAVIVDCDVAYLDAAEMAQALKEQGSDPEFLLSEEDLEGLCDSDQGGTTHAND